MRKIISIVFLCLFFCSVSCESNSDGNINESEKSNELIVGLFALQRYDELNKRYVESVSVTQGTWDTYSEGDNFNYKGYVWTILMKVQN